MICSKLARQFNFSHTAIKQLSSYLSNRYQIINNGGLRSSILPLKKALFLYLSCQPNWFDHTLMKLNEDLGRIFNEKIIMDYNLILKKSKALKIRNRNVTLTNNICNMFCNSTVEVVDSTKILGIIFNKNLYSMLITEAFTPLYIHLLSIHNNPTNTTISIDYKLSQKLGCLTFYSPFLR